jgi:hypothetical protein
MLSRPGTLRVKEEVPLPKVTIEVPPETLAEMLGQLSHDDLKLVLTKIAERLEIQEWMHLGEQAFQEWLSEPDLYADDRSTG